MVVVPSGLSVRPVVRPLAPRWALKPVLYSHSLWVAGPREEDRYDFPSRSSLDLSHLRSLWFWWSWISSKSLSVGCCPIEGFLNITVVHGVGLIYQTPVRQWLTWKSCEEGYSTGISIWRCKLVDMGPFLWGTRSLSLSHAFTPEVIIPRVFLKCQAFYSHIGLCSVSI